MKKWKNIKKSHLAALVTGVLVIGAGVIVLISASGLDSIFEPKDYERFNNQYEDGEDFDSVAGDGEESDLADENEDGDDNTDDAQKALQVAEADPEEPDTTGLADDRNHSGDAGQEKNPDAFEISDDRKPGGIDVRPDGSGDGDNRDEAGERPGDTGNEEKPDQPGTPDTPGKPDVPDKPVNPDVPDKPDSPSWEDEQLKPRDPVQTENGVLARLTAVIHREYCQGDIFRGEDATVTAVFRQPDGREKVLTIPYGGENGYSVQMSTRLTGKHTATFTYLGVSARAVYEVISSGVEIYYYGVNNGSIYVIALPGPLGADQETTDELTGLRYFPSSGGNADLTDIHSRLIAYLGNQKIRTRFLKDTRYSSVVFLEEKDGYLTTMLSGFRYYLNGNLTPDGPYVYYPVYNWGSGNIRNIVDEVSAVPEGYKIRRTVQDEEDLGRCRGGQVLEQYTGDDTILNVPMGVTDIELKGVQGNGISEIRTMILPESVDSIDFAGIAGCLPKLTAYETTGGGIYQAVDGVLYSRDKETLISVPAGKTDITIPETVTTIAGGAFRGSSISKLVIPETVTHLEAGCFEDFHGEVICMEGEGDIDVSADTEYKGKVLFVDSLHDVVLKRGIFAFKGQDITFGAMDGKGAEIPEKTGLYHYDTKREILTLTKEPDTLAGIRAEVSGYYGVPDGITAVSEGAFAGAQKLREISLPDSMKELRKGSLIVSDSVKEVFLSADMTQVSPQVFGDPAKGEGVPDIVVCVPEEFYDSYLSVWTPILDPVYGAGTAGRLLQIKDDTVFYENDAKYQKLTEGGAETYRLLEVYGQERTAFRVKEGTAEIAAGAFSQSVRLEILYLPRSLAIVENGAFAGCESLETVTVMKAGLLVPEAFGQVSDGVTIYEKGARQEGLAYGDFVYDDFIYDDGMIYGKSADGGFMLIDVPTDYSGAVEIRKNTVCLNREAFRGCTRVGKIELIEPGSLREIGSRCFEDCTSVAVLKFDGAKRLEKIGEEAFRSCTALETLYLPDGLKEMSKGLCYDCTSLRNVSAGGVSNVSAEAFFNCQSLLAGGLTLDWEQLTKIGGRAFAYCSLLASLPDMPKLESLGERAFFSCQRLKSVVLPEMLASMGEECFGECGALTRVELNGKLTGIGRYCFYGCRELVEIVFSEQQRNALQVIGVQAFGQCTSLEALDLSGFPLLQQMGERTFEGCDFLTTVKLPENLKKVPDYCFENCKNLSILTLISEEVTELGEAVFGDTLSPFIHIWVKEGKLADYLDAYKDILDRLYGDGTVAKLLGKIDDKVEIIRGITFEITDEGRVLKEVSEAFEGAYTIPHTTVRIEADAFAGCAKLTAVTFPENSAVSLGDRCFKECTALESVEFGGDIPQWGEETFMGCTSLRRVAVGTGKREEIPRVGTRAFKGCTRLVGRDAVSFMARMPVLGEECFADCVNLEAIPMSEYARSNLEVIEDRAFAGCKNMTLFLTSSYTGMKSIGAYAFADCDSLKNPSIPAGVTSIGQGCFSDCENLTTVSFYCVLEEYPADCFKNCPKLSRTGGVPGALAGLRRIGDGAYEGCVSLTTNASWNLGRYAGLEEIGANAFRGCTSMTEISLSSTVRRVGAGAFDGCVNVGQLTFQSEDVPEVGEMRLLTMGNGFCIRVPDSQAGGDRVYKAYLALFAEMFGNDKAYEILDSISDGAKGRNPIVTELEDGRAEENAEEELAPSKDVEGQEPGESEPGMEGNVEGQETEERVTGTDKDLEGRELGEKALGMEGNAEGRKPGERAPGTEGDLEGQEYADMNDETE